MSSLLIPLLGPRVFARLILTCSDVCSEAQKYQGLQEEIGAVEARKLELQTAAAAAVVLSLPLKLPSLVNHLRRWTRPSGARALKRARPLSQRSLGHTWLAEHVQVRGSIVAFALIVRAADHRLRSGRQVRRSRRADGWGASAACRAVSAPGPAGAKPRRMPSCPRPGAS